MLNNFLTLFDKQKISSLNIWLAHDDASKPDVPEISGKEIIKLLETISKIMNILGGRLNSETWMWSHVKEDATQDTKLVIDHLRRFEPYRLKEIEEEANAELERYKKLYRPSI